MKKKLLYIGHYFHSKTKSTAFLTDYLAQFFDVDIRLDNSWETNVPFDYSIITPEYEVVIFFQLIPNPKIFSQIKHKNIVFAPMYDQSRKWGYSEWLPYKDIKILNFSKTMHDKLSKWGFNSLYIQYFPQPKEFSPGDESKVFFWQRLPDINIDSVVQVFKNKQVDIHIHKTMDSGLKFQKPDKQLEEKYHITYSDWFENVKDMEDAISSRALYIAPRLYEGIGMSFLDAMAMGKAVVANNKPTMSEYITNNETGYLINFKNPKPIELKNIKTIQKNAYEYIKSGYEKWMNGRKKIIEFVNSSQKPYKVSVWKKLYGTFLGNAPLKFKLGKNAYFYIFGYAIVAKED